LPLAKLAKKLGVRATLDHPLLELNKLLLDEMMQLADLGVYVGTYCFIRALLAFGIDEKAVKIMLHDNPAKLMYLD
jgi:predicted metal-dependent phosphotriesterase family hydrolase